MTADSDLVKNCINIFRKRGNDALEKAKTEILTSPNDGGVVSSALKYFARVTLRDALPVFPALVSLSCEAAGGKTGKTIGVGAALVLIASAADVHDDILDKSVEKYGKKTVYGKFGETTALLAGDALLFEGLALLQRECAAFSEEQKRKILSLVSKAFYKISKAEAREAVLKGKLDIPPEKYLEILRLKNAVPEVHCQIGTVIAGANDEVIAKWGEFGEVYGDISTMVEEFADLLAPDELENRIKNECPPLPFLYALKNPTVRHKILQLVSSGAMSAANTKKAAEIVMGLKETQDMFKRIKIKSQKEVRKLPLPEEKTKVELASLLLAPIVSLQQAIKGTYG